MRPSIVCRALLSAGLSLSFSGALPRRENKGSSLPPLSEHYRNPIATGENVFSLQDARNLIRYGGMRPDRDYIQVDPALAYGLTEYRRVLDMLNQYGWSSRRCIPHGGHQFSLHIAAALKLGGNESYPGEFQPTGGFTDDAVISSSRVSPGDLLGIGLEGKAEFYRILRSLHS